MTGGAASCSPANPDQNEDAFNAFCWEREKKSHGASESPVRHQTGHWAANGDAGKQSQQEKTISDHLWSHDILKKTLSSIQLPGIHLRNEAEGVADSPPSASHRCPLVRLKVVRACSGQRARASAYGFAGFSVRCQLGGRPGKGPLVSYSGNYTISSDCRIKCLTLPKGWKDPEVASPLTHSHPSMREQALPSFCLVFSGLRSVFWQKVSEQASTHCKHAQKLWRNVLKKSSRL